MLRLFVALELPEDIKHEIAPLCGGLPDARWVLRDNMHLTLRFVGEIEEPKAEDVHMALSEVRGPEIEITLAGVDCFESRGRVRSIWTAARGGEALTLLQGRIEAALKRAGLPPDGRKFTPHVTLARMKGLPAAKVAPYLELNGGFRAGPFSVEHFTLFRSHMGHGGSHYEPLADYELDA